MEQTCTPTNLAAATPQQCADGAIDRILDQYRPTRLDAATTQRLLPRIREVVAAVGPRRAQDAYDVLSTFTKFLAEQDDLADCGVDEMLTETRVSIWSHARVHDTAPRTLGHHMARLNRLLRAVAGHDPRVWPPAKPRSLRLPHAVGALRDLVVSLTASDPAAAAALLALAGAGLAPADLLDATVESDLAGAVVATAHAAYPITAGWVPVAAGLDGVATNRQAWGRARRAGEATLGRLDATAVRRSWIAALLLEPGPVVAALNQLGPSFHPIDAALCHLPPVDPTEIAVLLRGSSTDISAPAS